MDLRLYYKKVREAEAALQGDEIVLVSLATPEGGKEGVMTEAPKSVAAKFIAEGRARVASDEETAEFRGKIAAAFEKHQQEEAARQLQVVMVPKKSKKERN
jgi:hypothetical protein